MKRQLHINVLPGDSTHTVMLDTNDPVRVENIRQSLIELGEEWGEVVVRFVPSDRLYKVDLQNIHDGLMSLVISAGNQE